MRDRGYEVGMNFSLWLCVNLVPRALVTLTRALGKRLATRVSIVSRHVSLYMSAPNFSTIGYRKVNKLSSCEEVARLARNEYPTWLGAWDLLVLVLRHQV